MGEADGVIGEGREGNKTSNMSNVFRKVLNISGLDLSFYWDMSGNSRKVGGPGREV